MKLGRGSGSRFRPGNLRDLLVSAGVRLLILDVATDSSKAIDAWDNADRFASFIVGAGGPPILLMRDMSRPEVETYLEKLLRNILHNVPLRTAAEPSSPDLTIRLYMAKNADGVLQFDRWVTELVADANLWHSELEMADEELSLIKIDAQRYLHSSQVHTLLSDPITMVRTNKQQLRTIRHNLGYLMDSPWSREPAGVSPLSKMVVKLDDMKTLAVGKRPSRKRAGFIVKSLSPNAIDVKDTLQAVEQATQDAPRVLNAALVDDAGEALKPDQCLIPLAKCGLLVDIGPKWDKIASLTQGHVEFPEDALPADESGHVLDVVVVSDDFSPNTARAKIWLPRRGRSSKVVDGAKAPQAGPVRIDLHVPALPAGVARAVIRARVSIYYGANVLQSGVLEATVASDASERTSGNRLTIDYAASAGFAKVEQFSHRSMVPFEQLLDARFENVDPGLSTIEPKRTPVTASFTLNSDGGEGNRIIYFLDQEERCGFLPYDVEGNKSLLARARDDLTDCFWNRAANLTVKRNYDRTALDANNAKSALSFRNDLKKLALTGEELGSSLLMVRPDAGMAPDWVRGLRSALVPGAVIQIARAGPAQYVLPWAMFYTIPLPSRATTDKLKWCSVIRDWESGASQPAGGICPYEHQPDHQEDMLCPYGFWGLRCFIEQPFPSDGSAAFSAGRLDDVPASAEKLSVSVARTQDKRLDGAMLDEHFARLRTFSDFVPSTPADSFDSVRKMLPDAPFIYFLCHGERNGEGPYLQVGPNNNPEQRVYAKALSSLALTRSYPMLSKRPIVFINGCHTCDLAPGEILNFATAFASMGATGVLGTEVSVILGLAAEIGEQVLSDFAQGYSITEALYRERWRLVKKWNLLGLAYTVYGFADLRLSLGAKGNPKDR